VGWRGDSGITEVLADIVRVATRLKKVDGRGCVVPSYVLALAVGDDVMRMRSEIAGEFDKHRGIRVWPRTVASSREPIALHLLLRNIE
jgi:hypothetical protein